MAVTPLAKRVGRSVSQISAGPSIGWCADGVKRSIFWPMKAGWRQALQGQFMDLPLAGAICCAPPQARGGGCCSRSPVVASGDKKEVGLSCLRGMLMDPHPAWAICHEPPLGPVWGILLGPPSQFICLLMQRHHSAASRYRVSIAIPLLRSIDSAKKRAGRVVTSTYVKEQEC